MAEQPAAERTEPATPKRRQDAREKGDVAQSRDVSSVVVLALSFAALAWVLRSDAAARLAAEFQTLWSGARSAGSLADYHALLLLEGRAVIAAAVPMGILVMVAALLGPLVQIGPLFSTKALEPKWERIDPLAGMKRLVSPEKAIDLVKAFAKLAVVAAVLTVLLRASAGAVVQLAVSSPGEALRVAGALAVQGVAWSLGGLAILAVFDLAWVRYRYSRKLRMTRQEVREELRDREGQPEQRSRMRALQRELSRSRMIEEVASADLVVRNPTHFAVALHYERGQMGAPRVVAKGRNRVALRILDEARRHDVAIVENPPLARSLYRSARVGAEIPEALYQAVAEAMAFVFRMDRRRGHAWGAAS